MNFKWNWGTKLAIAIIAFVSFMIGLVYMTTLQPYDLVEKDYYPKAQVHQQQIDKIQNAKQLSEKIKVENSGGLLRFTYQQAFKPDSISGTIYFYRPAGEADDFHIPIHPDTSGTQEYPTTGMQKGKYIIQFDYEALGKSYYQEETIIVNIY
jgi:hypothetical protein